MKMKENQSARTNDRPPSREELIQRIIDALENASYMTLYSAAVFLE